MKIAYFDGPSGAAGDMILGALIDAGLDADALRERLRTLPIESFRLEAERTERSGIGGTRVRVVPEEKASHRGLPEIEDAIRAADLPEAVREGAIAVFRLLGGAEAKVHRMPIERVHFHEVGAIDAIVDIVGAVTGLWLLGVERVFASAPVTGTGTVRAAHGELPVPAPATLEILRGRPFRPSDREGELLTPTGAALLVGLTERFGPPPPFRPERIGYGFGSAEREGPPNLLRVTVGEGESLLGEERVILLETDLDDLPGEILGALVERSMERGALDAVLLPTVMKKNRPGHRVSLLAKPEDRDRMVRFLMEETGTLGVRVRETDRIVVRRETVERETPFGSVRFKAARLPSGGIRLTPEHEDCARIAGERNIPLLDVWRALIAEAEKGRE
ncbi:MAG: nickel pincer cofactor biosynthesis protein LarC [Candidatus Eisenbacteria bacterium]|nr:nickel pincer cofactor biosynthesis protein LarC [Candidatus Eisenbacteria bacterium]